MQEAVTEAVQAAVDEGMKFDLRANLYTLIAITGWVLSRQTRRAEADRSLGASALHTCPVIISTRRCWACWPQIFGLLPIRHLLPVLHVGSPFAA